MILFWILLLLGCSPAVEQEQDVVLPQISHNVKNSGFKTSNKNVSLFLIKPNGVRQYVDLRGDVSGFGDLYFHSLQDIFIQGYTGSYVIKSTPLIEKRGKLVPEGEDWQIEKVDYVDGVDSKVYPHFDEGHAYSIKLVSINKEVAFIVDSKVSIAPDIKLVSEGQESILKNSQINDSRFSLSLDKKHKYNMKIMRDGHLIYSDRALYQSYSSKLDLNKMLFNGGVPSSSYTGRYKIRVSAEQSEVSQTNFTLDFGAPMPSFVMKKEIPLEGYVEKNLKIIDVDGRDGSALLLLDNNNHKGVKVVLKNGKKVGFQGPVVIAEDGVSLPIKNLNGPLYIEVVVKDMLGKDYTHKGVVVLKNNSELPSQVLSLDNVKHEVVDGSVSIKRDKDNSLGGFFYSHLNQEAKWASARFSTGKRVKEFVADKLGNFDLQVKAQLPVVVELEGLKKEIVLNLEHPILVQVFSDFPAIQSKLEFVSFEDRRVGLNEIVKYDQAKGSFGLRLLNGDDYPAGTKLSLAVGDDYKELATLSGDQIQFFPFSAEWIEALPNGLQDLQIKAAYGPDFRVSQYSVNVIDPFDRLNLRVKKKGVRNIKASDVLVDLKGLYLHGMGDRDVEKYKASFAYKIEGSKRASERSVDLDKLLKGKAKLDIKGNARYICSIVLEYKTSDKFRKSPFTVRKKFILDKRDLFQEYIGQLKLQQAQAWPVDLKWDDNLKKKNSVEVWLDKVKAPESFDVSMFVVEKDKKPEEVNVTKRHELVKGDFEIKVVLSNFWGGVIGEKTTFIHIDKSGPKILPELDGIVYIKLASNNPVIVLRDTEYGVTKKAYIDVQDKKAQHYMNIDRKNARHFQKAGFNVKTTFKADGQMLEIEIDEPMVDKQVIDRFSPNLNLIVDGPLYHLKVLRVSKDFSDSDIDRVLKGAEYFLIQSDY